MSYLLSTIKNYSDLVRYENDISVDYKEFLIGKKMDTDLPITYSLKKNSDIKKIMSAPILESSGPELINVRMKEVLELVTNQVQFFNADIFLDDKKIDGFFAINPIYKTECLDMSKCEYKPINFDPKNPEYMFYFAFVQENVLEDHNLDVVRCKEMPRYLVVSEKIKKRLVSAKIKGLRFYKTLDITPNGKSVFEDIK